LRSISSEAFVSKCLLLGWHKLRTLSRQSTAIDSRDLFLECFLNNLASIREGARFDQPIDPAKESFVN
jgi:hypothetical protein